MHAATLSRSPRLQRLHDLLKDGLPRSTWEIAQATRLVNVGTYVSELRANGCVIECRQTRSHRGERIWIYQMTAPAPGAA